MNIKQKLIDISNTSQEIAQKFHDDLKFRGFENYSVSKYSMGLNSNENIIVELQYIDNSKQPCQMAGHVTLEIKGDNIRVISEGDFYKTGFFSFSNNLKDKILKIIKN